MEDIRGYRIEEDEREEEREMSAPKDDEVPFHIPRD
jgi:hypothetical protein